VVTDVPSAEIRTIAKLFIGLGVGGSAASWLCPVGLLSGWRGQLISGKSTRIYPPFTPQCTLDLMHHSWFVIIYPYFILPHHVRDFLHLKEQEIEVSQLSYKADLDGVGSTQYLTGSPRL
jgi:hypothetical protein